MKPLSYVFGMTLIFNTAHGYQAKNANDYLKRNIRRLKSQLIIKSLVSLSSLETKNYLSNYQRFASLFRLFYFNLLFYRNSLLMAIIICLTLTLRKLYTINQESFVFPFLTKNQREILVFFQGVAADFKNNFENFVGLF